MSGFGKASLVFLLSWCSVVEAFLQGAAISLVAAITDIGWLILLGTKLAGKVWTKGVAEFAATAKMGGRRKLAV